MGGFLQPRPPKIHDFLVVAFNREDGSIKWRTKVKEAVPHEGGHSTSSQAPNSPICDGERIFAHFGSRGLHCLDLKGKILWSKDLGRMRTAMTFGEGSSPALHGDTLVVPWDHEGESFVVALHKRTGKERWRKERRERTSWSTPLITTVDGKPQVIVAATGKRHYRERLGLRTVYASPVGAEGRVYVTSREGTTKVLKLGATFEELATNPLDDVFDATPAIVGDRIYLRGRQYLYCLADVKQEKP